MVDGLAFLSPPLRMHWPAGIFFWQINVHSGSLTVLATPVPALRTITAIATSKAERKSGEKSSIKTTLSGSAASGRTITQMEVGCQEKCVAATY